MPKLTINMVWLMRSIEVLVDTLLTWRQSGNSGCYRDRIGHVFSFLGSLTSRHSSRPKLLVKHLDINRRITWARLRVDDVALTN